MGRKKKKNPLPPRRKRVKRSARLQSAVSWLKEYPGKNVLKGYCRAFGVNWRCAAMELRQLGVHFGPEYLKQREVTERELAKQRRQRREQRKQDSEFSDRWYDHESPLEAYLAEDFPALHDMECKRNAVTAATY